MPEIPDFLRKIIVLSTAARIKEAVGEDTPPELAGQAALLVSAGAAIVTHLSREEFVDVAAGAYDTLVVAAQSCDCSSCDEVDCPARMNRTGTEN